MSDRAQVERELLRYRDDAQITATVKLVRLLVEEVKTKLVDAPLDVVPTLQGEAKAYQTLSKLLTRAPLPGSHTER